MESIQLNCGDPYLSHPHSVAAITCKYIEHPEHPQRSASPARAVHRIFLPENSVKTFCEDLLFFPFSITSCLLLAHIHSSLRGLSSFYSGGGCNSPVMLLFLSFPFSFARLTARSFSFFFLFLSSLPFDSEHDDQS